ncbi:MAG: hypothetical protein EBZ77_11495 [Chitinophagia bacterium]|nr:hypothetical protein [Chitinophagia bacterium]
MEARTGIQKVAAGGWHAMALRDDGSVVTWLYGKGTYGSTYDPYGVTNVPSSAKSGVVALAAGDAHCLALKSDGSVVAWGKNNSGQINVPSEAQSGVMAIAAGSIFSLALKTNGVVVGWGSEPGLNGATNVAKIVAGSGHALALRRDGTLIGAGVESYLALAPLTGVADIAAGNGINLAMYNDGTLYVWGNGQFGQRDVPANLPPISAFASQPLADHFLVLGQTRTNNSWGGAVFAWGRNYDGETDVPADANGTGVGDVKQLVAVAGAAHAALLVSTQLSESLFAGA